VSDKHVPQFPEARARDHIRGVVESGANLIPIAGGALVELAEVLIAPSLGRRRDAWAREVSVLLADLAEAQLTPEQLATDDDWVSAVFEASRVAMSTHVEEKLRMLRELLKNMAIRQPRGSDQLVVRRFLRFIEELDEEHFAVLKYSSNPTAWFERHDIVRPNVSMGPRHAILEAAEVGVAGVALAVVLDDLGSRRLLNADGFSGMVRESSLYDALTTPLGDQLLDWIWAFE
jgi:hypothetical protein